MPPCRPVTWHRSHECTTPPAEEARRLFLILPKFYDEPFRTRRNSTLSRLGSGSPVRNRKFCPVTRRTYMLVATKCISCGKDLEGVQWAPAFLREAADWVFAARGTPTMEPSFGFRGFSVFSPQKTVSRPERKVRSSRRSYRQGSAVSLALSYVHRLGLGNRATPPFGRRSGAGIAAKPALCRDLSLVSLCVADDVSRYDDLSSGRYLVKLDRAAMRVSLEGRVSTSRCTAL